MPNNYFQIKDDGFMHIYIRRIKEGKKGKSCIIHKLWKTALNYELYNKSISASINFWMNAIFKKSADNNNKLYRMYSNSVPLFTQTIFVFIYYCYNDYDFFSVQLTCADIKWEN